MEHQTLNIFSHPEFEIQAKGFQNSYELYDIVATDDSRYSKRNQRTTATSICRFCGLGYPDTKFSNLSHLLSKMIGNTNLYSGFECDKCNAKFSNYESDLADFLGIGRSITGLSCPKGTVGYVGRKIGAKSRSFVGNNILILAPEDVKREGTKTTISYVKNAYTLAKVYKALLKCALSLLSDKEVKNYYRHAIDYLSGKGIITSGAVIMGYQLSFQTNFPLHVYAFRKKFKKDAIPTHMMCFYFQNHIIAFPLPFHEEDNFYSTELDILLPPPYFVSEKDMAPAMPVSFLRDMTSIAKVDSEEESIIIQIDPEDLKDSIYYDPYTDTYERAEYNPASPKYLIFTKPDLTIDPRELSAFMAAFTKKQMEGK